MKRIGIFTSGGDSPGMNACIRAAVRTALNNNLEVFGIKQGFNGMIKGDISQMYSHSVSNIIQRGGTILKSARSKDFFEYEGRKKAFEQLQKHGIDALVAIGGNGTFTGAMQFEQEFGIPTVGCPGTIDNDLYGTDHTIGYDTAVNTALEAIDKIRDTADSHDRVFFVEVMGRDSGYIAIPCGIGGGAELVMIPETKTTIDDVVNALKQGREKSKTSFLIVVAEGDEEGHATQIVEKVKAILPDFDYRVSIIGHIQRGGAPTALDRMLASKMGMGAVDGLLAGKRNVMCGVINNVITYTDFHDTIYKKKPINVDLLKLVDLMSI
jgi:6-phosphofructokinase 1